MNKADATKVCSVLDYFQREFNILMELLSTYNHSEYGEKATIQNHVKKQFQHIKIELKKQIKVLIEFDSNILVVDYLLPPLCVAFAYLQDVGLNRINPNSIHKVSQLTVKANDYLTKYYAQLKNEHLQK
ncbi:hypothetical protein [Sutcliffiella deserti]|uniref:hypothetical protein n=1 Tax=Sutcliffiella deserti TaxID=2875501 RepID=UPI001CC1306F|nr:hypothetical protein [Sutcliffiella deserti]